MSAKHTPGDEVYSIHGEAGRYVARTSAGHIVEPVFDPQDGEEAPYYADPVTWREVFKKPPRQRLEADIAELEATLAGLTEQVATRRRTLQLFDIQERERMARIKQHNLLTRIDEWVAGKVTHFVVWERYSDRIRVKPFDEVMKDEHRSNEVPLLVLYGSLERDHEIHRTKIEWCRMSDGNALRVMPCSSEEEAISRAREAMEHALAKWRVSAKQYASTWYQDTTPKRMVDDMAALGMTPPEDLVAARDRLVKSDADVTLKKAREEADKAQLALQNAEAEFAKVTAGVAA